MAWMLFAGLIVWQMGLELCVARNEADPEEIVTRMEHAYSSVDDYRARLVIEGFGKDRSFQGLQIVHYAFKKPDKIRLDFESPHRGMIIVFPNAEGKVSIRPPLLGKVMRFNLDPRNAFLEISPGQQLNQSDLGLLIRNIKHSVTDMLIGDLKVVSDSQHTEIHVLSNNPFQRGIPTRYIFSIDRMFSLPVGVRESSEDNLLRRTVSYQHLKLNTGIPDSFFKIE